MVTRALVDAVKTVLTEKQTLRKKEKSLIDQLNRALRGIGYQVVPKAASAPRAATRQTGTRRAGPRTLQCPHCPRKFAQPAHLGRHVSAKHAKDRQRKTA